MMNAEALFLEDGDTLVFEDGAHLAAFLDQVFSDNSPWIPPGRNNGRTAAHRERYCLRYFLTHEAAHFTYPITVQKTERPDFIITDRTGRCIGVEHTDAGPEAYQRWLSQTENHEADFSNPDGFPGDWSYEDAVTDIVTALTLKTESINKFGYQDADSYVLLIHLLTNASLDFDGDFDRILLRLPAFQHANAGEETKHFDRVLIILNGEARYWE